MFFSTHRLHGTGILARFTEKIAQMLEWNVLARQIDLATPMPRQKPELPGLQ